MDTYQTNVEPVEKTDPVLAEHIRQIANKEHAVVAAVACTGKAFQFRLVNGRVIRKARAVPGRNDPCPCGSGTKYKKCHGK